MSARRRSSGLLRVIAWLVLAGFVLDSALANSPGTHGSEDAPWSEGRDLYQSACVACHGADGSGAPQTLIGFEKPQTFPDFTECDQSAPEYTRDWKAVIRDGGPARGFSEIMPAFGDVFTPEQIEQLTRYLRSLCARHDTQRAWPPGELNLPRAIMTEKAFPEDELVLTSSAATSGPSGFSNELAYEYRINGRNQLEIALPFAAVHQD